MAYPMGQIADAVGIRPTFVVEGLMIVAFMVLASMWNPSHVLGRVPRRPIEAVPHAGIEGTVEEGVGLAAPAGGG